MNKVLKNKSWWRPLWSGLIIHPTAKHLDRMGNSVWLYLYFLLKATQPTGTLATSYKTISKEMGVSRETIRKWLRVLKKNNYVEVINMSKGLSVQIRSYKSTGCPEQATVSGQISPLEVSRLGQGETEQKPQNLQSLSDIIQQRRFSPVDNVNRLNKLDNNVNVIYENKYFYENEFIPQNKEELLALDIAKGLQDTKNLRAYLNLTKQHSGSFLRTIFGQVKELPDDKIKKSKGAYFMFLVKKQCTQ